MELYERSETAPSGESDQRHEVWKGLVSGLAAGLAATWIMTEYQVNAPKLFAKFKSTGGQPHEAESQEQSSQPGENENPTIKVADTIVRKIGKRELPQDRRETAGYLVHYGYGTLLGGLYGVLGDLWPPVRSAHGVAYGAALWAAGDEVAVPALGLAKWAPEYPLQVHAHALGAHIVYAFSLDSIYSEVHRLLDLATHTFPSRKATRETQEGSAISEFRPPRERSTFLTSVSRTKETFGEESGRKVA